MTNDSSVTDSGVNQSAKTADQKSGKTRKASAGTRKKRMPPKASQTLAEDKNLGGRPPSLTWSSKLENTLKQLGAMQSTQAEAAAVLGVCEKTIQTFFNDHPQARDAFKIGRELGKMSLRRKQNRLAEKNAAMAIFLGKNYLDQTDKIEQHSTNTNLPAPGILDGIDLSKMSPEARKELRAAIVESAKPKAATA